MTALGAGALLERCIPDDISVEWHNIRKSGCAVQIFEEEVTAKGDRKFHAEPRNGHTFPKIPARGPRCHCWRAGNSSHFITVCVVERRGHPRIVVDLYPTTDAEKVLASQH